MAPSVPDFLVQKYFDNAAAFSKHFTNIFFNSDGSEQIIYPKQLLFLNSKGLPPVSVWTKSRQIGWSSGICGKVCKDAYFAKRPEFMIMSRGLRQAEKILRRIRSAFNYMPEWMRPEFKKETTSELILPNGSVIYSLPAKAESARGFTGDVYLDEFGTFEKKNGMEIWTAIAPATTKGYNIYVVGTPQGQNNFFFDLSTKSLSEISKQPTPFDSYRCTIHWSEVPHVAQGIDEIRSKYTPNQFAQEYDLKFLSESDDIFFSKEFLRQYLIDEDLTDKMLKFDIWNEKDGFKFREDAVPEGMKFDHLRIEYSDVYLGWDIASSIDSSIVSVFGVRRDSEKIEHIGMLKIQNTSYIVQSEIVSIIAQMVFAKRVAFDATGLGGAVKTMLDETKIKNILHPIVFNRNWKIDAYQNLRNLMYQGKLKAGDFDDIINEFNALHHDLVNNKIAAPRNLHDDIPSSFIVAIDAIRKKRVHAAFGFIKASPVPSQKFRTTSQMLDSYMKHYDGR